MRTLSSESVDAVVTDPTYGLKFMGRKWDASVPGVEYWAECLRILKPGGHLVAFGGTRTYHRLVVAIEDAGFDIRDMLACLYGSGFPKSHDVSKAIDREAGVERKLGPKKVFPDGTVAHHRAGTRHEGYEPPWRSDAEAVDRNTRVSYPATDEAKQWDGWGTALKPAIEPIVLARKPLIGTVAANVLIHGCGGLNIDACRAGTESTRSPRGRNTFGLLNDDGWQPKPGTNGSDSGRWPANLIHDGSEEVVGLFPETRPGGTGLIRRSGSASVAMGRMRDTVGCGHDDGGDSAARYFYCAKASQADRDGSTHPTIKPTKLMRYLCRLVTPPGGPILDPFMGSGSTGKAAILEGFGFVGIERDPKSFTEAGRRLSSTATQGEKTDAMQRHLR